jgi:uncharacterized protein (TIGR02246 family)
MEQKNSYTQGLNSTWEAIVERCAIFEKAMANGDAHGVSMCYTLDGEFMQPNQKTVAGRANIETAIAGFIQQGFTQYKVTSTTVYGQIDVVGVHGTYTLSQQGGKNMDIGKTVQLWKQEDGVWRIFRDCFNSDLPASS